MPDDELNALRDRLLCCCTGYNADEAIRAVTSTLATLIIGCARDQAAAHDAMNRLAEVMRAHAPHDSRAGARRKTPRRGIFQRGEEEVCWSLRLACSRGNLRTRQRTLARRLRRATALLYRRLMRACRRMTQARLALVARRAA
jgi:hypothetical protein